MPISGATISKALAVRSIMCPTMSLDSASSQVRAPFHRPTSTVQTIGTRWAVAAGHSLAAEAAAQRAGRGGNAIDAGVAAGFTLGVVHPDMVSFAGVAPILVHLARTGETWQVSGVGPYPQASSREYFTQRHGGQIPAGLPRTVVPAAPDAWCTALERWGTMSFADVAAGPLEHAERGFAVSAFSAYQMGANADKYKRWPSSVALYLRDGARVPDGRGARAERAGRRRSSAMVAAEKRAARLARAGIRAARDVFYQGEIGQAHRRVPRARGRARSRSSDLAEFPVEVAPALRTTLPRLRGRGVRLLVPGPGAAADAEPPRGVRPRPRSATTRRARSHLIVEAIKLAFADREAYYGDPQLREGARRGAALEGVRATLRRALIREDRAWPEMPPPGDPDGMAAVRNGVTARVPARARSTRARSTRATSAVIDAEGNGFSATPSDPNVDSPVDPGVGCVVSPRGSQGWLDPGHPSEVAPGKRPRLTPAPAMALRDGRAVHAVRHARRRRPAAGDAAGVPQRQSRSACRRSRRSRRPRVASRSFPDSFWPHADSPGSSRPSGAFRRRRARRWPTLGHERRASGPTGTGAPARSAPSTSAGRHALGPAPDPRRGRLVDRALVARTTRSRRDRLAGSHRGGRASGREA